MKHKQDIENLKTSLLLCACPSTFFRKLICDFRISFFFAARNSSALSTSAFLSTNHRIPEFSSLGFLQKTRGNSQFLLIGDSENSTVIPNSDTNHIMAHPELLVRKRIRHCFQVGDELVWFNGIVINMNPESKEYKVQYDGEEETCLFTLLDDITSRDLELL